MLGWLCVPLLARNKMTPVRAAHVKCFVLVGITVKQASKQRTSTSCCLLLVIEFQHQQRKLVGDYRAPSGSESWNLDDVNERTRENEKAEPRKCLL